VEVSADGAWIVFVADAGTDGVDQLYSMPGDGSEAPRLLADRDGGSGVFPIWIPPAATRVLYSTSVGPLRSLSSVPIDGSAAPVELVEPHVQELQFTPDSARVVFRGDLYVTNRL